MIFFSGRLMLKLRLSNFVYRSNAAVRLCRKLVLTTGQCGRDGRWRPADPGSLRSIGKGAGESKAGIDVLDLDCRGYV